MQGGAPQVRLVGVQPGEPATLAGPGQMRGRRLGDRQIVRAVSCCHGGGLVAARLGEPLGGELADGLQQPVAQRLPGRLGHHQALIHKRAEQAGDLERLEVTDAADCFGGVQIEAFGEHRQAPQQQLLGAVQQRIRPLDGGCQGLLPRQSGAASPGQEAETLVETVCKATQRQRAQPGSGQLDGQRQPVQPLADRHHQRGGPLVDHQGGALRPGPLDEQRDRIGGPGRR